jgi:hypothetical protein
MIPNCCFWLPAPISLRPNDCVTAYIIFCRSNVAAIVVGAHQPTVALDGVIMELILVPVCLQILQSLHATGFDCFGM